MPHKNTESVIAVFFSFSKISICKKGAMILIRVKGLTGWRVIHVACCSFISFVVLWQFWWDLRKQVETCQAIFPNPLHCFKGIMQVTWHYFFLTGPWWSGFRGETRGGCWRQWDGGENNKIYVTRKQVDLTQHEWKAKGHEIHEENILSISLVLGNRPWRPIELSTR
jgi:hypothetical protein